MTYRFTIKGRPITKKNHQRLVRNGYRVIPIPSKEFIDYQDRAGYQIPYKFALIDTPVNVKVLYYMPTHHRVDLVNLLESTCDILVKFGVVKDDNSEIIVSHDGSRVLYDKQNPRAEIEISEVSHVHL